MQMSRKPAEYGEVLSHIDVQKIDAYMLNVKTGGMCVKKRISNKMGKIQINPDVIVLYAGTIAVEYFGIVGMAAANMKDGLVKLLKRESLTYGISVAVNDNRIPFDFRVIVSYGVSMSAASDNLIGSVRYRIEKFTGIEAEKINIFVEGVRVTDQEEVTYGCKYN